MTFALADETTDIFELKPPKLSATAQYLVALIALTLALWIAGHHPLSARFTVTATIAVALVCAAVSQIWLLLIPFLLPIIDLAPWTGWLTFEEFDLLVLSAASGAWFNHARRASSKPLGTTSSLLLGLMAVFMVSTIIAFARGIADAGGFRFSWYQGYTDPMNSVRLAKSFVLAALFGPLAGTAIAVNKERSTLLFAWGMALGLAVTSLAATWERIAFPGLLNFSADYRTTALFWEMHVGGATLDGFLVMSLPFAVALLIRAHRLAEFLPAAMILAMGVYASLTTFSRGVFLALLVSMALLAFLLVRTSHPRPDDARAPNRRLRLGIVLVVGTAATLLLSHLVFRNGGYRALIAALGCLMIWMAVAPHGRLASSRTWSIAIASGIFLTAGAWLASWLVPKGAYWAYAVIFLMGLGATMRHRVSAMQVPMLASATALPLAAALIADHWGGTPALADSVAPLVVITGTGLWNCFSRRPVWPEDLRRRGAILAGAFSLAAVAAIFGGGAYMGDRLATSEKDFAGRVSHWRSALELLRTPGDWLFGKGLGRFPASFFFGAPGNEHPGSYRVIKERDNAFLSLSGPRYQAGYGEVLRVSQRIRLGPPGRYRVEFDARSTVKANLVLEICTKHLLYAENCASKGVSTTASESGWRHYMVELDGKNLSSGSWYAPQLVVFNIALDTLASRVDVDNLAAYDPLGQALLANSDFSSDTARWFFTSDHHHMPWHMKNMFLHVLFEQGVIGLVTFTMMVIAALFRSMSRRGAYHPLAQPTAAAIVGFLVVGLFDSLLDAPRLAFLFFLLVMIAIQCGGKRAR